MPKNKMNANVGTKKTILNLNQDLGEIMIPEKKKGGCTLGPVSHITRYNFHPDTPYVDRPCVHIFPSLSV